MKVRIFFGFDLSVLESEINDFIYEFHYTTMVDIKITSSSGLEGDSRFIAMVIYKNKE